MPSGWAATPSRNPVQLLRSRFTLKMIYIVTCVASGVRPAAVERVADDACALAMNGYLLLPAHYQVRALCTLPLLGDTSNLLALSCHAW